MNAGPAAPKRRALAVHVEAPRLAGLLDGSDWQVSTTADIVGALIAVDNMGFDALLCSDDAVTRKALLARCPGVPVIVVGVADEAAAIDHLAGGAADALLAPGVDGSGLLCALDRAVARAKGQHVSPAWRSSYVRRFHLLKDLFDIAADAGLSFTGQLAETLRLGCEFFGLEIGIVSRVAGQDYRVEHVYAPDTDLAVGQEFRLGDTICDITLRSDVPLGIDDLARSPWRNHPCKELGLAAYIGVPLVVKGHRFGTLAFASPRPRIERWTDLDLELAGTLASWAGTVLGRARMVGRLRLLATHDSLTGFENRDAFIDSLARHMRRAEDAKARFALLFLDLDGFKQVNDTHGHAVGDEVLITTSMRLRTSLRPGDVAGRLGGDEFVIRLDNVDEETAVLVARRLAEAVSEPIAIDGKHIAVGASIGIAMSGGGRDAKSLLAAADEAMYEAKGAQEGVRVA